MAKRKIKLGINVDHIATLRQARGGVEPSPLQAALESKRAKADGITVHLREDRRHIQDQDVKEILKRVKLPLNLEMSLASDIVAFALKVRPPKVCLVPERRQELTTEGGLDVVSKKRKLKDVIAKLKKKKIEVSLFIDPDCKQIEASHEVGADVVELHTGCYANATGAKMQKEFKRLLAGAERAHELGLIVNAGHGLDYQNVKPVAMIPNMNELNIGHSIVSRAAFVGMYRAVQEMRKLI